MALWWLKALEAARQLEQSVSAAVIDMFTLKPIDRMLVKNYAENRADRDTKTRAFTTGWARQWQEVLVGAARCRCVAWGAKRRCGRVGRGDFLEYGLTAHDIVQRRELL